MTLTSNKHICYPIIIEPRRTMNHTKYPRQTGIIFSLTIQILTITTALIVGEFKSISRYDALDILGEGAIVTVISAWLIFSITSRPAGSVSNQLMVGLNLILITALLDFMDEFIFYTEGHAWLTTIESLPAVFGLLCMTFALKGLHFEQKTISRQLFKQERFYRNHLLTDYITGLNSAPYIREQINNEIHSSTTQSFSLLMIDISQFDDINLNFGEHAGNQLLSNIAQILMINVRDGDLVCRYAGDCFIILLADTALNEANHIAQDIERSIKHIAFRPQGSQLPLYLTVKSSVITHTSEDNAQQLIDKLSLTLHNKKLVRQAS